MYRGQGKGKGRQAGKTRGCAEPTPPPPVQSLSCHKYTRKACYGKNKPKTPAGEGEERGRGRGRGGEGRGREWMDDDAGSVLVHAYARKNVAQCTFTDGSCHCHALPCHCLVHACACAVYAQVMRCCLSVRAEAQRMHACACTEGGSTA